MKLGGEVPYRPLELPSYFFDWEGGTVPYHVVEKSFKELPDRITVREDGYLSGYKMEGLPIVDHIYVPLEERGNAMFCLECGCDCVETRRPMVTEYKGVEVTVRDVPHWECICCGESMVSASNCKLYVEKVLDEYERRISDGETQVL